jgi:glutathione S-transferase
VIYHIAYRRQWELARRADGYRQSTRGLTLEQVGYIHASRAHQVAAVANRFFAGERDLLVLAIDEGRVRADVRDEPVPGSAESFPHIHGPLNADAVVEVIPLEPGPDGLFTFAR